MPFFSGFTSTFKYYSKVSNLWYVLSHIENKQYLNYSIQSENAGKRKGILDILQCKSYFTAVDEGSEEPAQDHTGVVVAKQRPDSRVLEPQSSLQEPNTLLSQTFFFFFAFMFQFAKHCLLGYSSLTSCSYAFSTFNQSTSAESILLPLIISDQGPIQEFIKGA